jgi:hypothetical protein
MNARYIFNIWSLWPVRTTGAKHYGTARKITRPWLISQGNETLGKFKYDYTSIDDEIFSEYIQYIGNRGDESSIIWVSNLFLLFF